jgi:hypothetical protein
MCGSKAKQIAHWPVPEDDRQNAFAKPFCAMTATSISGAFGPVHPETTIGCSKRAWNCDPSNAGTSTSVNLLITFECGAFFGDKS